MPALRERGSPSRCWSRAPIGPRSYSLLFRRRRCLVAARPVGLPKPRVSTGRDLSASRPPRSIPSRPGSAPGDLGVFFLWLAGIVGRHHPVGIVGLGRHVLWQLGLLELGLLLGQRRRSDGGVGVRTRRQVGGFQMRRGHFQADLDRGSAERVVGFIGAQMRTASAAPPICSASAPEAASIHSRREGLGSLSRPDIAISPDQGFGISGAAGGKALSGATPSSATSLILA